jgi:hypothetical protein
MLAVRDLPEAGVQMHFSLCAFVQDLRSVLFRTPLCVFES